MFKKSIGRILSLFTLTLSIAILPASLFAGGNTSGGGDADDVSAGALKILIEGQGLKKAMINYLQSLPLDQVETPSIRGSLVKMQNQNALMQDIQASKYKVATPEAPCKDFFEKDKNASTSVGVLGSDICFDVKKLVKKQRGLDDEEIMIHMAALAFHEHTHHFQKWSEVFIKQNEDEANGVGGYVLITAKFITLPLLKWSKPGTVAEQFESIESLYRVIRAKEQAFIAPSPSDYAQYPDFKGKTDRGLIRLLPREKYEGKLSIQGGGAYFSFARLSHEYGFGSDIALENKELSVGFAGCDFGYILPLGFSSLDKFDEQSPALQFLVNFKPANHDEPTIRQQQGAIINGPIIENGVAYYDRIEFFKGELFALRSVAYDSSDTLVLFKVLRIGTDGSVTLAWKKLKSFPAPSCRSN